MLDAAVRFGHRREQHARHESDVIPITTTIDNGQNAVIVAKPTPVSAMSPRAAINNATLDALPGPRSCDA